MADDLKGTVRKMGTVIEDSAGRMADNTRAAAEGLVNQAADVVHDNYGKAVDSAKDGIEAAKLDKAAKRKIDAKSSHLYKNPPVKGAAKDEYRANFEKGYQAQLEHQKPGA